MALEIPPTVGPPLRSRHPLGIPSSPTKVSHEIRAPCIKPAINQGWGQLHSNFILINIHWQPGSSDHGPNTNGLITGAFLWSHHDRRHLIMCIFMSTFMCRSWQCWLRHHKSSLTKGPVTSLRFHFVEVPCQDTYLDWRPVDEAQRAQNYDFFFLWYKIDYYRSGHFSDMHLTLPNGEKYISSTVPSPHNPGIWIGSVYKWSWKSW